MHTNELVVLDRAAMLASVAVVAHVRRDDLTRPTPCAKWTLAELLAHMTAQHHGFAAAARGSGRDLAAWEVRPSGSDPVADYADATDDVLAAFAQAGADFYLPEFPPVFVFPAVQAVGFHLVDYVVHGWDVARSLGLEYHVDPELAEVALRIALSVPDGEARLAADAPFGPALETREDPVERILTALGRSPEWSPV